MLGVAKGEGSSVSNLSGAILSIVSQEWCPPAYIFVIFKLKVEFNSVNTLLFSLSDKPLNYK